MLLSFRLLRLIEEHADQLTVGVVKDLQTNFRTPAYHHLSQAEISIRVYDVYHNLGRWVDEKAEECIEGRYKNLGKERCEESVPLSQVVYALTLQKNHLWNYCSSARLGDSAIALYQEEELQHLMVQFFDKAIYWTVKGYEHAIESRQIPAISHF